MAEAVFVRLARDAGLAEQFEVDSAGTSDWHAGEPPCAGTLTVLAKNGIPYNGRARQVTRQDLADPETYVLAMDTQNLRDLQRRYGEHPRLRRLLDYAGDTRERDVPDPYYEGGFENVYSLIEDGCRGFLGAIRKEHLL